jgi:hypothetical protein
MGADIGHDARVAGRRYCEAAIRRQRSSVCFWAWLRRCHRQFARRKPAVERGRTRSNEWRPRTAASGRPLTDGDRLHATHSCPSDFPITVVHHVQPSLMVCRPRSHSHFHRPMEFDIEGKEGIPAPTLAQIKRAIKSLRSYGPSSYASLTAADGSYLQVAGGGVTCMVEHFNAGNGTRSRVFHDKPNPVFPDGAILAFRGGNFRCAQMNGLCLRRSSRFSQRF